MPDYIDAKGQIRRGRRMVYDDGMPSYGELQYDKSRSLWTTDKKPGGIPVLKDQGYPQLENMTLEQLAVVERDVCLAIGHLEANPKVSYVIVDNFGNVSRSRMKRQRERVSLEIQRKQNEVGPNRVVNIDLEDEVLPNYSDVDISCMTAALNDKQAFLDNITQEAQMTNVFDPEFYRRQAALNAATAEKLEGIPLIDIFDVGQVISFQKTSPGTEKAFTFAAVKIDTGWAMTGDRNGGYKTWQGLLEFIGIEALDTVAVMVTTPELSLKKYAENQRKAKELEKKATGIVADMSAKGQTFTGLVAK